MDKKYTHYSIRKILTEDSWLDKEASPLFKLIGRGLSAAYAIGVLGFAIGNYHVKNDGHYSDIAIDKIVKLFQDQPDEVKMEVIDIVKQEAEDNNVDLNNITPEQAEDVVEDVVDAVEDIEDEVVPVVSNTSVTDGEFYNFIGPHEGDRDYAYDDTKGFRTVGIGFNMDAGDAKKIWVENGGSMKDFYSVYRKNKPIDKELKKRLFKHHLDDAVSKANGHFPNYDNLPKDVKLIVVDMIFNMGSLIKFKNMRQAVNDGNWAWAADEMQYSDPKTNKTSSGYTEWYTETKSRGKKLVSMMRELAKK